MDFDATRTVIGAWGSVLSMAGQAVWAGFPISDADYRSRKWYVKRKHSPDGCSKYLAAARQRRRTNGGVSCSPEKKATPAWHSLQRGLSGTKSRKLDRQ